MSRSSWTATAAGRRRAACRGWPAIAPASRRCARRVRAASELGIAWLTVYAFSSENWSRPKSEVSDLIGLLKLFIRRDLAELHQNGVRVRIIGDRDGPAARHQGAARRGRGADRRQPRAHPGHRLQLWRPRRDRAGRAQDRAGGRGRADLTADEVTPDIFADASRHRRHSRSGPGHPHQRRDSAVEFPAVAGRLQRVRLPALLLAGFQPRATWSRRSAPYAARERRYGGVPAHDVAL